MGKRYYTANPAIVFREEEDGGIIFNPETGDLKMLNETGAFIFKLCDGMHREEDITKELLLEFEVEDEKTVKEQVEEFLKDLFRRGIIGLNCENT